MTLRPATAADIEAIVGTRPYYRCLAYAGDAEGRTLGVGALMFRDDGVWATVALTEEARRFKLALWRCAKALLAEADRMGLRRVLAMDEPGREGAAALLARLGFARVTVAGAAVWVRKGRAS